MGPFKPAEVLDLLRARTISGKTLMRESASPEWQRLDAIERFAAFLEQVQDERMRRADDRAMDAAEQRVRSTRRLPLALGLIAFLVLAAAGGWYGYERYRSMETVSESGYASQLLRPLELSDLAATAYAKSATDIEWADEKVDVRHMADRQKQAKKPARRSGGTPVSRASVDSADDLPAQRAAIAVRDISFGAGGPAGRVLTSAEVNSVRAKIIPKLIGCAQRGGLGAPGTSVRFTILANGRMGNLQIGQNGSRVRAFSACVKSALRSVSVEKFDASAGVVGRTITVPLQIKG